MASEKKRREQRVIEPRKLALLPGAAKKVPKDGDRRHRGVDMGRQAQERKRADRGWKIDAGPAPASVEGMPPREERGAS